MKKKIQDTALSDHQIEKELQRTILKRRHWSTVKTVVTILLTAAAFIVLITTLWFPIYRVTGNALEPYQEVIVVVDKVNELHAGDLAALYHDGRIHMKRVIGLPGDVVQVDEDHKIFVNDIFTGEKIRADFVLDSTTLTYPYQVPEGSCFVIDGHMDSAIGSEIVSMECISEEKVAGKILFCIWPLQKAGFIG